VPSSGVPRRLADTDTENLDSQRVLASRLRKLAEASDDTSALALFSESIAIVDKLLTVDPALRRVVVCWCNCVTASCGGLLCHGGGLLCGTGGQRPRRIRGSPVNGGTCLSAQSLADALEHRGKIPSAACLLCEASKFMLAMALSRW
jgi:hypothetical protein